jgi:hypothetical protein
MFTDNISRRVIGTGTRPCGLPTLLGVAVFVGAGHVVVCVNALRTHVPLILVGLDDGIRLAQDCETP